MMHCGSVDDTHLTHPWLWVQIQPLLSVYGVCILPVSSEFPQVALCSPAVGRW